jgi:hypothetical protein
MAQLRENSPDDRDWFDFRNPYKLFVFGIPIYKWIHTDRYGNEQYEMDIPAIWAFIESGDCSNEQYNYIRLHIPFK